MPRKNNIQIRKGTISDWNSANPVLASGEPGFDLGNNILKIGDGSKNWNQLNPIGGGDLSVLSEEPNGFVNKDHSAISVNFSNVGSIGSGIFTISPTGGVSSYDVFIKGIKYNYGSLTGYIPDSTNLYFVYIDKSDKILKVKNTNPDFATDISVSYVYWNTDNNQVVYQAEERHGIKMDSATHLYLHRVFGAQYISGLSLTYNSLIGNGSTDIDAKIAISDGLIFDEDDQINISHSSNPNINNYEQILSPTGQIPIFYKDGAAGGWKYSGPTNYPVKTGTSAQYNQYTGGSWTTTNADNSKFIATWIVATNNMLYPIIGIMGQEVDDNIGQADTDNLWENLDLTDLPVVEMRPLYRLIFETDGRWSGNSSRVALRDVKDIRSVLNVTGGGLSPSDHGNLFGLLDDDHPQYVSIDSSRNISAIHNFSNGLLVNNIAVPTGAGSNNYVTKWVSSSGIGSGIIFDNGTNVGIGIVAPSALFSVHGGITTDYTAVALSNPGVSTTTHIGIGNSDTRPFLASLNGNLSTSIYGWGLFDRGTDGNLHLQRKGGSSSWSSVMMIDRTNGNIGIGTGVQATTPPEKLTVDGNIRVADTTATQGNVIQFLRGGGGQYDYSIGKYGSTALAISLANDPNSQRALQVGHHSGVIFYPKFHINGYTGDVGMGTVTPSGKLDVAGDVYVRGTGNDLGTIYFKNQNIGDKTLYVGAANGDLIMNAGGANLQLSSQGGNANLFAFSTQLHIGHGYDAGNAFQTIRFVPAAKEMMRMTPSGTLGIGLPTSTSSYAGNPVQLFNQQPYANTRVHIAGSGSDSGSAALIVTNSGISPLLYVRNDGNVGIGTTSPTANLSVTGNAVFGQTGSSIGATVSIKRISSNYNLELVGTSDGITNFAVHGGSTNMLWTSRANYFDIQTNSANKGLALTTNGGSLFLSSSGNVGIGTTTPTYKLEVNGSFAASTKSFRIHHPSKKDHSLEYGSLESPYHGVRLTGRGTVIKGVGVVSLPDYLKDLIHDDDTLNIQITNIKHGKTIYIDKIDLKNDRFIVKADRAKTLGNLEFFWTLSGVRKDVDNLVVEKRN